MRSHGASVLQALLLALEERPFGGDAHPCVVTKTELALSHGGPERPSQLRRGLSLGLTRKRAKTRHHALVTPVAR
jgi:hypothetical protein